MLKEIEAWIDNHFASTQDYLDYQKELEKEGEEDVQTKDC